MDFNDLPADIQILHLNIEEKLTELLRTEGPIRATGKVPDRLMARMVEAVAAAQTQTVEDVGGIRVEQDKRERNRMVVLVPRVAGWLPPDR